jgi:non-ribosomal peptide synthetase component F
MLKSVVSVKMRQFLENDRMRGFDLTKAPLMRLNLMRIDDKVYRTVVSSHHIITDGWSHTTILAKIFTFYQLTANGEVPRNFRHGYGGTEDGYKQFIEWTHKNNRKQALDYWRGVLAGFSEPTAIPIIGKAKEDDSVLPGKAEATIPPELAQKLKSFAEKNGFTISMVMGAAWGLLLYKYSGSNDIVFGSTVSIRPAHIDVNAVGLFMNTVPVRLIIDDDKPATEVVRALCKQQIERSQFEHLSVAAIQGCSDVPKGVSLMDSIFVVENFPIDQSLTSKTSSLTLEYVDSVQKTNFVLSNFAFFSETKTQLLLLYDPSFVQAIGANRMLTHYIELLNSFVQNPSQPAKLLPILTQDEKKTILYDWNQTYKTYPTTEKCVHQIVSEKAQQTPLATAVVYPREDGEFYAQPYGEISYAELDEMSNCLAQHLVGLGVKPDDLVGLCVETSSWVMVVSMLAIWKAGGAYVALNPKLPIDRLHYMMERASAKIVLTMGHLSGVVAAAQAAPSASSSSAPSKGISLKDQRVVAVDENWDEIIKTNKPVCPQTGVKPQNLAYVLFTSGSTGLPKGVMIEHKALTNMATIYVEKYLSPDDRVSQVPPSSFYLFFSSPP